MHVFLIDSYSLALLESFVHFLLEIFSYELYDPTEFILNSFPLEETEPINILFESIGYQNSDIVSNTGPVFVMASLSFVLVMLIIFVSYLCC